MLLIFSSHLVQAESLVKRLKHYSDWLGVNQPTLFCQCPQINGLVSQTQCGALLKARSEKLVPHYIFPLEKIAAKFPEYLKGANKCFNGGKMFTGLDCVDITNEKFREIKTDLHNLTLIEPSVQTIIKDKTFNLVPKGKTLGLCPLKYTQDFFQLTSLSQGWIARVYLYLDNEYNSINILDADTRELALKISEKYPPTPQECKITTKINSIQNRKNTITQKLCDKILRKKT